MISLRRWASNAAKSTQTLKKPNMNVKHILENKQQYADSIQRRENPQVMESLNYLIDTRSDFLSVQSRIDALKNERNKLSQGMIQLKQNKTTNPVLAKKLSQQLGEMKAELKGLTDKYNEYQESIFHHWDQIPNLLDSSVPVDPLQGEIVEFINGTSEQQIIDSQPASDQFDHKIIGEKLGLVDFATASKVSGFSWYYLLGDGALLEQALIQYGLARARQHGYKMITPPTLVKPEVVNACGFKPRDVNESNHVYDLAKHDLALTGTAEIALAAFHSSQTLTVEQFPLKYVGISRAYRAEAGARGKDTKGLYRVHEFNKVELFHFTRAEDSQKELEQLRSFQVGLIQELGLKAKMINMPTTDLGAPAMKKYDCEAWMPGRGDWGELTSSSNCGEYQARRLGIRYRDEEKMEYAHTLNGTCMAVPRVIVAIIEQNYDPETESVVIPEVLRPYMDGKERITKQ